jgi:uncharacterized caspase-like protein
MRAVAAFISAACSIWLFSQPALADKRVALVMGNSSYQNVVRLSNPINDSEAMSTTLKGAGFDVVDLKRDLKANEMRRALRDFSDSARSADVAIIYFAGHGIEIDGINYVIPVDAVLERDIDAFDEAIPLDRLLMVIEPAKQLRLIILDACRDNPFNKTMKRTIASRMVGRGLAKVEPTSPNTLIAFAAKAGSTASDGESTNSPFTAALVKYLPRPGLDVRKAFGFARDDVLKATNNKQEPFIYGSLGGDDVALVPAATAPQAGPNPVDPNASVRRDYELAERVGTREAWNFFLSTYADGFYAKLAQAQRNKLVAEEARVAATEKARLAVEEKARLAAEGAKASEQAKAAAQARAAEEARMVAERKKAIEEAKLAEAERAKAAAQAKEIELASIAVEKTKAAEEARATQDRAALEKKKALEEAKAADAERAKAEVQPTSTEGKMPQEDKSIAQLAALTPPGQTDERTPKPDQNSVAQIPRLLQIELRRVGCKTGAIDGNWNAAAQRSLALFNKNAQTKFDVKVASVDALDAVSSKPARICPLICEHGYKVDGNTCAKITCKRGYQVGDDNTCERIEVRKQAKPVEGRGEPAAGATPSVASGPNTVGGNAGTRENCKERAIRSGWSTNEVWSRCYSASSAFAGCNATCREKCRNLPPERGMTYQQCVAKWSVINARFGAGAARFEGGAVTAKTDPYKLR